MSKLKTSGRDIAPKSLTFSVLCSIHDIFIVPDGSDAGIVQFGRTEQEIDLILTKSAEISLLTGNINYSVFGTEFHNSSAERQQLIKEACEAMYIALIRYFFNYEERPKNINEEKHAQLFALVDGVMLAFSRAIQTING